MGLYDAVRKEQPRRRFPPLWAAALGFAVALVTVLGLVISVGIILLTVLLDNKIHTEDDVAKYLDLAVVGVIPEYQGGKKK